MREEQKAMYLRQLTDKLKDLRVAVELHNNGLENLEKAYSRVTREPHQNWTWPDPGEYERRWSRIRQLTAEIKNLRRHLKGTLADYVAVPEPRQPKI